MSYSLSKDFGLDRADEGYCSSLAQLFTNRMKWLNDDSFYRLYIDKNAKRMCKGELENAFQYKHWKNGAAATFVNDNGDIQIHRRTPSSIKEEHYTE
jgi:hypothetical protein